MIAIKEGDETWYWHRYTAPPFEAAEALARGIVKTITKLFKEPLAFVGCFYLAGTQLACPILSWARFDTVLRRCGLHRVNLDME